MGHSNQSELLRTILGGKWRLAILSELSQAPARLSYLRRAIPDASKKMIVDSLHALLREGLIEREDRSTRSLHVEYRIEDSRRAEILTLLEVLSDAQVMELPKET